MSKIITISDAVRMIRDNVKGTTVVSVDTSTDPRMLKTDNPYDGKVRKLNTLTGFVGFDYGKSVNRQAGREGKEDRTTQKRRWGTLTHDRFFVEHKGQFYVRMQITDGGDPTYIDSDTGKTIDKSVLVRWLRTPSKSKSTQSDLEKEVIVRDTALVNVKSMRFKGESYTLVGNGEPVDYKGETDTADEVLGTVETETETETETTRAYANHG